MFRRRRDEEQVGEPEELRAGEAGTGGTGVGEPGSEEAGAGPAGPPRGPWDVAQLPQDGINRIDLGGLLVPVAEGTEVRVDVDQSSGAVVSATVATAGSAMQVMAFAAPRTSGIWTEVREEILASITGGGGQARVVEGRYGPEIVASVPTGTANQFAPARFLGADGPRWFLRGLIQGSAATDPARDPALLTAFGQIVVVRGEEAMAVRDPIPLRLPAEAVEQAAGEAGQPPAGPDLSLPERGPEITETR